MLTRLSHWLSAAYLYSVAPYAETGLTVGHAVWAALLVAALVGAAVRARRRTGSWITVTLFGASLPLLTLQAFGAGPLSARIWCISTVALAVASVTIPALGRRVQLTRSRSIWLTLSVPLLVGGMATLLTLLLTRMGVNPDTYRAYVYPNLWAPLFDPQVMTLLVGAWLFVALLRQYAPDRSARYDGWILLVLTATWSLIAMARHLSHGATGSDPYCFLQMTADLVERGTLLSELPLARAAERLGIATWPTAPVGYNPPVDGQAAAVWPMGWPVLLAPLYALGGERLALWGAPLCHLAAALAVAALARQTSPAPKGRSTVWAGLAGAVLLTSQEGFLRTLVPMSDAAAQLMAALAFLLSYVAARRDSARWALAAGLAAGIAFLVRHPLLPLLFGPLLVLAARGTLTRSRWVCLGAYATGALLVALPDLIYHQQVFGAWWHTESPEWFLIAPRHILPNLRALWSTGWLGRREFGYLAPLVALGLWKRLARRDARSTTLPLIVGYGAAALFALCYGALRLRDLIPLFPIVALLAAWGAEALWSWARDDRVRQGVALFVLLFVLSARSAPTLALAGSDRVSTFGHMSAAQRDAYDNLAESVPRDAVILTGLNAGAVSRYQDVDTVRPASWSPREASAFLAAMEAERRPAYVLVDGEEMTQWLVEAPRSLEPLGQYDMPTFGLGGQDWGQPAQLYRVVPAP